VGGVADPEPGLYAAPIVDEAPEFSTAAQEDRGNMGFPGQRCHPSRGPIPHLKARVVETVAAPRPSATTSWAMSCQEKWRLIAFVFLPFATGYYLSYLYRTISALISTRLVSDLALQAADLGFLTSVYFLAFAAAQLPVGILLDRYGPRRIQSALLLLAAGGAALFGISEVFASLAVARVLIGLGVAASLTAGVKAVVLWFPKERVALANGGMVMFGALGAVTATAPAEQLLAWIGWRGLFELLAVVTAGCAALIYLVVPEGASAAGAPKGPTSVSLRTIYMDPRFWRLAPLAATCMGTAWSLQGLWAAPWLTDVEGLDRPAMVRHLFVMALALSVGALALGLTADRLGRHGVGPRVLSSVVTVAFIAVQGALILRVPVLSYLLWGAIAAVGATTVLGFAILAEYFPRELAGRATAALGVFYIGGTFSLQYLTGLIVQLWPGQAGHYPAIAYQTAFALNLALQTAALAWFEFPRVQRLTVRLTKRYAPLRASISA